MLFNSLEFAIFLPIVFLIYWFCFQKSLRLQNLFLIAGSYLFYGWWDWRFLFLIAFSSLVDFVIGLQLGNTNSSLHRKLLLLTSLLINLGFLAFFKYSNFFVESFVDAFASIGIHLETTTLNVILPIGISFYTFQTLSYTIDVYRNKLMPTKDIFAFFAFVSFFPQLVAGPIERATNLLGQFHIKRTFNYDKARDGMRQILWGFFKKIVIADSCAPHVNDIFEGYQSMPASILVLGAVLFAFQIYGDFSGYSDIGIGTAKLFGFRLMRNFSTPYFSRDIAEFWRRWHISLTTWFRDYLYIPLGGSRSTKMNCVRNILIIFTVSGLWHGANWTFIAWGVLNGLYFIPLFLLGKNRNNLNVVAKNHLLPSIKEFFQISITFGLVTIGWIFFRAENMTQAFGYINNIFQPSLFTFPTKFRSVLPWIAVLLVVEWLQRDKEHSLQIEKIPIVLRWCIYVLLFYSCLLNFSGSQEFIYFQF